jgi:predicted transcriptional regulator
MNLVTLSVASRDVVNARFLAAAEEKPQGAHISFSTMALMWKILTPKRSEVIHTMTGQGVLSIREVARRVGRDVKAVHGDVTALIKAGVIDRRNGGVIFPYDGVHVDFMWGKAA